MNEHKTLKSCQDTSLNTYLPFEHSFSTLFHPSLHNLALTTPKIEALGLLKIVSPCNGPDWSTLLHSYHFDISNA